MTGIIYDTATEDIKERTICGINRTVVFVIIGVVVFAVVAVAIICGVYFGIKNNEGNKSTTTPSPITISEISGHSFKTTSEATTISTSRATTEAPDICREYKEAGSHLGSIDFIGYDNNRTQLCDASWNITATRLSYFGFKMIAMHLHGVLTCPYGSDMMQLFVCSENHGCKTAFPNSTSKNEYCIESDFKQDTSIHPLLLNEDEYFRITLTSNPLTHTMPSTANGSFYMEYSTDACGENIIASETAVNITSPLYGLEIFPTSANCTWIITPGAGINEIELTFYHFYLNTANFCYSASLYLARCSSSNGCENEQTICQMPSDQVMPFNVTSNEYLQMRFETGSSKVILIGKDPGFLIGVQGG